MFGISNFLRYFFWINGRTFLRHPLRLLAVLLGVALGATSFTSVRLAVDASLDAFTRSMDRLTGKADWSVVCSGGRVRDDLVASLLTIDGVKGASPLIMTYVKGSETEAVGFLLIGIDPILDRTFRDWQAPPGQGDAGTLWLDLMRTPNSLLLSSGLASRLGLAVHDEIRLEHVHGAMDFRVLGVLAPHGLGLVEEGNVAICDIATMQEFIGVHGRVDRIDLRVAKTSRARILDRVREMLPPGTFIEPASARKETGKELITAYQLNLSVLSFISLFVGMFLVYSLVSINAASRRKELAIFRSLGASSRLAFGLILSEGVAMGILGWIVAIPIGRFLINYWVTGIGNTINTLFVRVQVSDLQLDRWEIMLSFLATVFISAAGAYKPARQATRIRPREVMALEGGGDTGWRAHKPKTAFFGLALIVAAWPVAGLPGPSGVPVGGYIAVFLLIGGFSFLSLPFLKWAGGRLPRQLRRIGGVSAFLAGRYLRGVDERTSISVGAMVIAMALFVSLVTMVHSFRETVNLWVNQTLSGDLFVRARMAGMNQYRDSLPEAVVKAFGGFGPETEPMPYRRLHLNYNGAPYQLEALDLAVFFKYGDFMLMGKTLGSVRKALLAGEGVLVSEVFSNRTGLVPGDLFQVRLGVKHLEWPILGIARDYRTRGGAVFVDFSHLQHVTGNREWSGVRFFVRDREKSLEASVAALRQSVISCCALEHPLELLSGTQLRRTVLEIFDDTFAVTVVLLFVALAVAGLGIAGTLTVLVMERRRQLNTLTAIGASRAQLRRMVFWESILMVAAGEGIGLISGFCLSWLLIYVINPQSFGWTFLYRVDWVALAVSLPLILTVALVAAIPAVQGVVRLSPGGVLKVN